MPSEPRRVVAVAAYAEGRVIGDRGRIPWHISEDFAHFKAETLGHTLVMGRLTFDAIGRPLPGRRTVVVTRDPGWAHEGVEVAHSVDDALDLAARLGGDTVVAGGGQVYAQAMPRLTHQVLTEVHLVVAGDAHYPAFDPGEWRETRRVSRPDLDWVWLERVTATPIEVVPWSAAWAEQFERLAADLRGALIGVRGVRVEHVGSTSVPGLAAKPVLDVDVVVDRADVAAAVAALEAVGYVHRGDLGVTGREALRAPDDDPRRHVYVCEAGTLHVRNHVAVREVLRRRADLRDEYAAVKLALAADPDMDIDRYLAGKTAVLQRVLAESDLTPAELDEIRRLNDPTG